MREIAFYNFRNNGLCFDVVISEIHLKDASEICLVQDRMERLWKG